MNDRPSDENIRVSLQELRKESTSWAEISEYFASTKRSMDSLVLNGIQMGIFAPIHGAYDAARARVAVLMEAARGQADEISSTLSAVASQYEHEEEVNVQTGKSIHEEYEMW